MESEKKTKAFTNILAGWDDLIEESCQLEDSLATKTGSEAALRADPDLPALFEKLYRSIEKNLSPEPSAGIANSNWKLRRALEFDEESDSPEKRLEKRVVQLAEKEASVGGPLRSWFNQMPAASDYAGLNRNRKNSIDLVHEAEAGKEYDFVELKVLPGSGRPFYATCEVLSYGFLYLLTRTNETLRAIFDSGPEKPVLGAGKIRLMVLAPSSYFEESASLASELGRFERSIDAALRSFAGTKVPGLEMSFEFRRFLNPVASREEIDAFVGFDPAPCGERLPFGA